MFDFANRETMMIVAVIVSLTATYYIYTEMKKQKTDMYKVKAYVSHKLAQTPANDAKKPVITEEVVDEEEEEVEEEEED